MKRYNVVFAFCKQHLQPGKGVIMDFLFFFIGLAATIAALCHIKKTSE